MSVNIVNVEDAWVKMTKEQRYRIKQNLMRGTNRFLCICETLRLIYDLVYTIPDVELRNKITARLIDAFAMGKKMSDRLSYYKKKYGDVTGSGGKNMVYILDSSRRRIMRKDRKPL